MLKDLFPRGHRRHVVTRPWPGVGWVWAVLDRALGIRDCVRIHVRTARHVDARAPTAQLRSVAQITRANLRACAPPVGRSQYNAHVAATVRLPERHLDERAILSPPGPPSPVEKTLADYGNYLQQVRGLASSTIKQHRVGALAREHIGNRNGLSRLSRLRGISRSLSVSPAGEWAREAAACRRRTSLLAAPAVQGLASGLDTRSTHTLPLPGEQLPRASRHGIPSAPCSASVDRSTPGRSADYAMLLLIATYGLRTSEVVGLTLEAIEWRAKRLRGVPV